MKLIILIALVILLPVLTALADEDTDKFCRSPARVSFTTINGGAVNDSMKGFLYEVYVENNTRDTHLGPLVLIR